MVVKGTLKGAKHGIYAVARAPQGVRSAVYGGFAPPPHRLHNKKNSTCHKDRYCFTILIISESEFFRKTIDYLRILCSAVNESLCVVSFRNQ